MNNDDLRRLVAYLDRIEAGEVLMGHERTAFDALCVEYEDTYGAEYSRWLHSPAN